MHDERGSQLPAQVQLKCLPVAVAVAVGFILRVCLLLETFECREPTFHVNILYTYACIIVYLILSYA